MNTLLKTDTPDTLTRLLLSWRLWLVSALLGALLGWGAFALFPPDYRAEADVIVDHNLETAWVYFTDRQLFNFLSRETRKLEILAWNDETLAIAAASVGATDIETLRQTLQLSQPGEGAWHFWATHPDPARAEQLAQAWATAFEQQVIASLTPSAELQTIRAEMLARYAANDAPDPEELEVYANRVRETIPNAEGISPYIEVALTESGAGSAQPSVGLGAYLLAGSLAGVFLAACLSLFLLKDDKLAQ